MVSYPKQIFSTVSCANGCSQSSDANGDITCSCQNISIFNVQAQLSKLYDDSNLHLLTFSNIKKIFTSAIFLQWSFWVTVTSLLWYAITLKAVKTWNKDYCMAKKVRSNRHENSSRGCLYKFYTYLVVTHPLLRIYYYKGSYDTNKANQALIYFVRVMALLGTSAIFMNNSEDEDVIFLNFVSNSNASFFEF
jgi:hypothetical protein